LIKLVYPSNGHTTAEKQTFVVGATDPKQLLTLNGQPVVISPKGYFSQVLPLSPGSNTFVFRTASGEERPLTINRQGPVRVPNGQIRPDLKPTPSLICMPGDWVSLTCVAGANQQLTATYCLPDGTVWLSIPLTAPLTAGGNDPLNGPDDWFDDRQALFAELTQTTAPIAKQCVYTGKAQLPKTACDNWPTAPLTLFWQTATQRIADKATLSLWQQCRFGQVTKTPTVMRTSPPEGSRLTPQQTGAWLTLTGKQGPWWRVRLSGERTAWLPDHSVSLLPEGDHPPSLAVPVLTLKTQPLAPDASSLLLPGWRQVLPYHLNLQPNGLTLEWFGAVSHCDFIHYHPQETVIKRIEWSQPNMDTFTLDINLPRLCGAEVVYKQDAGKANAGAVVNLKRLPTNPRILLDPGHGGSESGSMGPDGTPEKALNLALSLKVAAAMRQAGLNVTLTRTQDVTMGLVERTDMAADFDMVISLHHNALPDGRDPQKSKGLSTYYYHAMAKPLADALFEGLGKALGVPKYGVFYDSLALTRIPTAMAVLVEVGFMTNPQEYERVQDPAFQQQFAMALSQQVKQFVAQHG
jgi:N-acetylmuramoyl-L-alanine amidase